MCGIAGYVSLEGHVVDPRHLQTMAGMQRHRGPDHTGHFVDGHVALGSQRLAIIDLAGGNQPIFNEDGAVVVVCSGEIYNHRDLRRTLESSGHRFATMADTEVLVHAYEEHGADFIRDLNGMFAFALWDRRHRRLLLARDHLGMKPLYYTETGGGLWFASEIKALLAVPAVRTRLDPRALAQYLLFQNIVDDSSLFSGIRKLRPGHCLDVQGRLLRDVEYWDVPLGAPAEGRLADHLDGYRHALRAAVGRHLMSDVEIGAYVSGGYDSSAVALLAAGMMSGRMRTFTGGFSEHPFYDERPVARAVAARCDALPHEVEIDAESFWSAMNSVCYALDEPSVGSAAIPQYRVAEVAARHVKVVLTGLGGDELLLGYPAYKAVHLRHLARRHPLEALGWMAALPASELPRTGYFLFSRDPVVRHGLLRLFPRGAIAGLLAPELRAAVRGYEPEGALEPLLDRVRELPAVEQTSYLYLKTYLPTLLLQEDKVGMAHSLEARMPLCDREFVEFMSRVPVAHRLHLGRLKYFARAGLRDLLPIEVLRQGKRGFPVPLVRWFKGVLRGLVERRLFSPASEEIFDPRAVRRLWNRFQSLPGDGLLNYYLANRLYSVLTVIVWHDLFGRGAACGRDDVGGRDEAAARHSPATRPDGRASPQPAIPAAG